MLYRVALSGKDVSGHLYLFFDPALLAWVLFTQATGVLGAAAGDCHHAGLTHVCLVFEILPSTLIVSVFPCLSLPSCLSHIM